jgi:ribonuclease Z
MAKIFIMGSANAIPTTERDNTYFFIENGGKSILIDCGAGAFLKLQQSRTPVDAISDLIITHFHPDHVSGLPLLVMDWWLLGRKVPLTVHGSAYTIERIQTMLDLYSWKNWPNFFPLNFHTLPEEYCLVLDNPSVRIYSHPVQHLIPTLGLRFEMMDSGKSIVYSCDTEPCDGVITLARGADILIHEAAGNEKGHSTARQCGREAAKSGVKELYLIHYPDDVDFEKLVSDAKSEFPGEVTLARDMMVFE